MGLNGRRAAAAGCVAVAVSWLGLFFHNVADLPGHSVLDPESAVPALVAVGLLVVWLASRGHLMARRALLAWGWLHLVGGALSVLPLPVLPYAPEQSLHHYAAHAVYAAAQLPLVLGFASTLPRPRADRAPPRRRRLDELNGR